MKKHRKQKKKKQNRGKSGKKLSEEQEQFILALWRKSPEKIKEIRKINERVYEVLVLFYGLGRVEPLESCETIRRLYAKKGITLTQPMIHGLKYVGLCLLGWVNEHHKADEKYQKRADELLENYRQKTQKGETKMEFERIQKALLAKHDKGRNLTGDDDFYILLKKVEKAWQEREGSPKDELPLCFASIYVGIAGGLSLGTISGQMNWDKEVVLLHAEVVFCLAYPDNMTEARNESKTLYGDITKAYNNYLSKAQSSPGETKEAGTEGEEGPKYYALLPMKAVMEKELLKLFFAPSIDEGFDEGSYEFGVLLRNNATEEKFQVVLLAQKEEIEEEMLQKIKERLAPTTEIIILEASGPGGSKIEFYCFLDQKP